MLPQWFIAAAIAGILSNSFNSLSRITLTKTGDATVYAWFFQVVRLGFFISLGLFTHTLTYSITFHELQLLILLGFVEVAAIYTVMKMHQYAHLSISTIIQRSRSIWVAIIAYFLLGEVLETYEYIGILFLFIGLAVTTQTGKVTLDKGIKVSLLAAFITAWISILMKLAANSVPVSIMMMFMSIPSIVLLPIFMKSPKKRIKNLFGKQFGLQFIASVSSAAGMLAYVYALTIGSVSKVSAIYQAMMFVSIITGVVFLGERDNLQRKFIGAILTLFGIVLLALK